MIFFATLIKFFESTKLQKMSPHKCCFAKQKSLFSSALRYKTQIEIANEKLSNGKVFLFWNSQQAAPRNNFCIFRRNLIKFSLRAASFMYEMFPWTFFGCWRRRIVSRSPNWILERQIMRCLAANFSWNQFKVKVRSFKIHIFSSKLNFKFGRFGVLERSSNALVDCAKTLNIKLLN